VLPARRATIRGVTRPSGHTSSLRAIKVARTRVALIDAAVEMCLDRGYEHTTVDQIAAAADVSPRTFARYFPGKDAVFVAVLDDLAGEVASELHTLPAPLGPIEAMRVALRAVLERTSTSPLDTFSSDRLTRIIRVVTSSDALRRAAVEYRGAQVLEALADRMNVEVDDPRLALVMSLVSVTVVHAWGVVNTSDGALDTVIIAKRIDEAFFDLAGYAADLGSAAH
jgi:AcrR family transcriptional regulator